MSLKTNNILYKEKYDGVLYYYQVHALFRCFVRLAGEKLSSISWENLPKPESDKLMNTHRLPEHDRTRNTRSFT